MSTGAITVDLPGVHDANGVQATVAEGCMKQCSGLWIVTPIIRAVDDKAAKINPCRVKEKQNLPLQNTVSEVGMIVPKRQYDKTLQLASMNLTRKGVQEDNEEGLIPGKKLEAWQSYKVIASLLCFIPRL